MSARPKPKALGFCSGASAVCLDCGNESEFYMTFDDVWHSVGLGSWDTLCLGCLSRRLGRDLVADDFYFGAPEGLS